jgi:hypothetical protein
MSINYNYLNKRANNLMTPSDLAETLGLPRDDWPDEIPGQTMETIGDIIKELETRGVNLELLAIALYAELLGRSLI